jgi:hypothetical protein
MNESNLPLLLQDEDSSSFLTKDFAHDLLNAAEDFENENGEVEQRSGGVVYLDHAGATLASHMQLADVFRVLAAAPMSNPHSVGTTPFITTPFPLFLHFNSHPLLFSDGPTG